MSNHIIICGDALEVLEGVPSESVNCCVTSPPYWGLRNYHVAGQLGLERTPEEFVARLVEVFREVRRVLRRDGVLFLNLGDSYARPVEKGQRGTGTPQAMMTDVPPGLKPKDLAGIPWLVAKALQSPYYTGRIKSERDRVWMAAILDGEGTICGFTHERQDHTETHHSIRTGVHLFVTNSAMAMLDECQRIWPASQCEHGNPGEGHLGNLPTERWIVQGVDNRTQFIREIYPYLIVKKKQAIAAYTLLEMMADAKHLGKTPERHEVWEKRARLVEVMSDLNHQRPVDLPDWCSEPPSVLEPGWYLRSDIIWHKPNPMPESVTDRPTKAHEYIFLLAKSGTPQFWVHRDKPYAECAATQRTLPAPDYRWSDHANEEAETDVEPPDWRTERLASGKQRWGRVNLWRGYDYYYDAGLIQEPFATDPKENYPARAHITGRGTQGFAADRGNDRDKSGGFPPRRRRKGSGNLARKLADDTSSRLNTHLGYAMPYFYAEHEGRNRRSVWTVTTKAFKGAHFATFPTKLIEPMILAGCPPGGLVLDCFSGAGTTGLVALRNGRNFLGIELNPDYCEMANKRIEEDKK